MVLLTDLSDITLAELQIFMIYGIGAFVLYVVALLAIIAWELRQAKQTQGATSMLPYITKSFIYVFGWYVAVTLVFLVLISVMPGGTGAGAAINPASGIHGFWHYDWLSPHTWQSLNDSIIKSEGTAQQLSTAKFMALVLMVIKLVYHIMLIAFFFMIFSFVHSIPALKMKQSQEETSFAYIGSMFLHFVFAVVVYQLILGIMSIFLTGLLTLALSLGKMPNIDPKISIIYDLTEFVRLGIDKAENSWESP